MLSDLLSVLRQRPLLPATDDAPKPAGFFLVFEGGEASGKSTQARAIETWVQARGHEVLVTREPGGTAVGRTIRGIVLDPSTGSLAPQAEALLYAADRAQHVASVVRPALEAGTVVIGDRYIDSSLAYQGAGRELLVDDVWRISTWATNGLVPDLTVLLDLPAEAGAARRLQRDGGAGDRLEAEPTEFHDRVRRGFLELAAKAPQRYLVIDATNRPEMITELIRQRLRSVLPLSAQEIAEQEAVRQVEAARLAEERRVFEEERRVALEARRAQEEERRRLEQQRTTAAMQAAQRQAGEVARVDDERARVERAAAEREAARLAEAARVEAVRQQAERERAQAEAARQQAEQARAQAEAARSAAAEQARLAQARAAQAAETELRRAAQPPRTPPADAPTMVFPVASPQQQVPTAPDLSQATAQGPGPTVAEEPADGPALFGRLRRPQRKPRDVPPDETATRELTLTDEIFSLGFEDDHDGPDGRGRR